MTRFEYDHGGELWRKAEINAARRASSEARLERPATKGMSNEGLAIERAAVDLSLAETEAAWRQLRARSQREIWGEAVPEPEQQPGPLAGKLGAIQRMREKRAVGWERWLASFEDNPERLAQERAWIQRRERQDRELIELEATMRRSARVGGDVSGAASE